MGLSPQRITVSTSGLVAGIEALARADVRPALALSVNATTDEARGRIMPVTRRNSLAALRSALLAFPLRSHEKITLEYVLLAGENDGDDDAARLAAFATGMRHNINVIPWNPFTDGDFARPDDARTMAFVARLRDAGCLVTVRKSRGRDVAGACGQLATDTVRLRRPAPAGPR
jgi:23S rRNA (adenine2503-C2)-methyltransferase